MMTSSNGNIFCVTGPLCGEFPGDRWIPLTKASDAELWCFIDLRLNKRLSKQTWGWCFETSSGQLWRHCNGTWLVCRAISFPLAIIVPLVIQGLAYMLLRNNSKATSVEISRRSFSSLMSWWLWLMLMSSTEIQRVYKCSIKYNRRNGLQKIEDKWLKNGTLGNHFSQFTPITF